MLYILHGPDDFSVTRELDKIKQTSGDPSLLATNTVTLDGGQVGIDELRVACETVPFLADKRLVIVYGLISRFAPRSARAATSRRTEPADATPFANLISAVPPFTILVLIDEEARDTNPLFKLIAGRATIKTYPLLKGADLRQWVAGRISSLGGSVSPTAINLLVRLIGGNLWIMSSEIDKLLLYATGRRIEEADVKSVVSYTQEVSVFNMVDAIVEFDIRKAESTLQQLLREGESAAGLLVMLNRQVRFIVRARELKRQGVSEREIGNRLHIAQDFLVRKVMDQASRYTLPRLREVYQQLLETDLAIKTGKYEGELALNILVAELCQAQRSVTVAQARGAGF